MIVTSDTSPLTNLSAIARMDILEKLFGSIIIPDAVANELIAHGREEKGAVDAANFQWIKVQSVKDRSLVRLLCRNLHLGEAEAIVLARETGSGIVLLDEKRARRTAELLGIKPLGLLGILIEAKRRMIIERVTPILYALTECAGFYVHGDLLIRILQEVDE